MTALTFPAPAAGYAPVMSENPQDSTASPVRDDAVKGGPANHAAHSDLDAPTTPGGPQRQDAAGADVNPNAATDPAQPGPDPEPSEPGGPSGPQHDGARDAGPGGVPQPEPDPDAAPSQREQAAQLDNAESSLDQPSQ